MQRAHVAGAVHLLHANRHYPRVPKAPFPKHSAATAFTRALGSMLYSLLFSFLLKKGFFPIRNRHPIKKCTRPTPDNRFLSKNYATYAKENCVTCAFFRTQPTLSDADAYSLYRRVVGMRARALHSPKRPPSAAPKARRQSSRVNGTRTNPRAERSRGAPRRRGIRSGALGAPFCGQCRGSVWLTDSQSVPLARWARVSPPCPGGLARRVPGRGAARSTARPGAQAFLSAD